MQIQDVDDPEIRHITRPILANTSFKFLFLCLRVTKFIYYNYSTYSSKS